MDIRAIEQFCDRWILKAGTYRSDQLEDLFDRFFTLFVAFNRFYSAIAELDRPQAARQNRRLPGDRMSATVTMARRIDQGRFIGWVQAHPEVADACRAISHLLANQHFFLHGVRVGDQPAAAEDLEKDQLLAEGLAEPKLIVVLQCLYQIRCNMFHGEKEFAQGQAELLLPAITLLEAIVELSRAALVRLSERREIQLVPDL